MADLPAPPIPELIQRYLNGESMQQLAREHQVNRQTLYNWMLAATGPEYEHIITQALVNRIAEADHLLETAPDQLGITRAREMARYYRQDFERRRPKLYGQKQEVAVDNKIEIIIKPAPKVVETPRTTPQVIDVIPPNIMDADGSD